MVAVVAAGVFLALALSVSAQDGTLSFSDVVTSSDSAVPLDTTGSSTPTVPPSTTPPSSPPPAPASPPPSPPAVPPALLPPSPATPLSPPPVSAPVSSPSSPASSPAGTCSADYSKNFANTFLITTDTEHVIVGSGDDSVEMILDETAGEWVDCLAGFLKFHD